MSLFKGKEIKELTFAVLGHERRLDAADTDRRRLKGNLDKLGGQVTDLECKVKSLKEGKCNGSKRKLHARH